MKRETDVAQAVRAARKYLDTAYADEAIRNVGLEEVVFDERLQKWKITLGFLRDWDIRISVFGAVEKNERSYKVVMVDDRNGEAESMIDRILPDMEK